jgi:hypothetical protein
MLQNSAAANEYVTDKQENCRCPIQAGVDSRKLSERNQGHEMNAAADARYFLGTVGVGGSTGSAAVGFAGAGVAAGAGAAGRGAARGAPGAVAAAGLAGFGVTAADAPVAGAFGFGTAAGVPAAGPFAAGAVAAGFAAAAGLGAGRKNAGVGRIPDFVNSINIIRKKIPAIIAHTNSSMIPSIPLVSSPLVMSQTIPQRASSMKRPQIALISIAVLLDAIPSSLPAASAVID